MRLSIHARRRMKERRWTRGDIRQVFKHGRPKRGRNGAQVRVWLGMVVVTSGKVVVTVY